MRWTECDVKDDCEDYKQDHCEGCHRAPGLIWSGATLGCGDQPLRAAITRVRDDMQRDIDADWVDLGFKNGCMEYVPKLTAALSVSPNDVLPNTSTIARVVADMRTHQGHIQLGACIRGWCDALAGVPVEPATNIVPPKLKCDGCDADIYQALSNVYCIKCYLKEPPPGTIAAADVAAVRERCLADRDQYADRNQAYHELDNIAVKLQALIDAAGEGEQWVTCEPCKGTGKGRTFEIATGKQVGGVCLYCCGRGEVPVDEPESGEPVVPLQAVEAMVVDLMKGTDFNMYTVDRHLAPYRPAAQEPCTCEKGHWWCPRCDAWINGKQVTYEEIHENCQTAVMAHHPDCTDCQPKEPDARIVKIIYSDNVDCAFLVTPEWMAEHGPELLDKPTPPQEPPKRKPGGFSTNPEVDEYYKKNVPKLTTPPPTYAQRAAYAAYIAGERSEKYASSHAWSEGIYRALDIINGEADDDIHQWLQAQGDEEATNDNP